MTREVVISGMGCVSAFGRGVCLLSDGVFAGRSAITTLNSFDTRGLRSSVGASVEPSIISEFLSEIDSITDKTSALGIMAAEEAVREAGCGKQWHGRRTACCFASVGGLTSEMRLLDDDLTEAERDQLTFESSADAAGSHIYRRYGIDGALVTFTTACAAGANAIGHAFDLIMMGEVDIAVAGGAASLNRLTYASFNSLRIHSRSTCRPFDIAREGLCLGEGAACLVLESRESATERRQPSLGTILGYGMATDTNHVTQPHPDGQPVRQAILESLERSNRRSCDVGYVNAHGTGTKLNDTAEANAICGALGSNVPVSSTKGSTGHMLEAAGVVEAIISAFALARKKVPPTYGLDTRDPDCRINVIGRTDVAITAPCAVSVSIGFGGGICVLVLGD